EELVGAGTSEPARARARCGGHDEFERSGPATPARRLGDREVSPEHELPALGHRDREELTGPGALGDLRRDQGDRLVDADLPAGQDLGARALHAEASATPAASSKVSRACTGRRREAA